VRSETYNKLFTVHGIVMIFFFTEEAYAYDPQEEVEVVG
jgi:heme/copper-type cytochrome/quinol oxidase subunit 1